MAGFSLRHRSRHGEQVYVNDIKISGRGKTRAGKQRAGFDMRIEADIPGVGGNLSSNRIGAIWVAELIDNFRKTWASGKSLSGRKRTVKKSTRKWRYYHKWALTGNTAKTPKGKREQKRAIRNYKKNWTLTKKIDGIKTKTKGHRIYIPNPYGGAVTDSGLMSDSLTGKYLRARNYIAKNGQRVNITSHLKLAVVEKRANAARYTGGMNANIGALKGNINSGSFRAKFPNTADLVNNALYWRDRKTMIMQVKRIIRVLNITARVLRVLI